jgi:hypothetical protein
MHSKQYIVKLGLITYAVKICYSFACKRKYKKYFQIFGGYDVYKQSDIIFFAIFNICISIAYLLNNNLVIGQLPNSSLYLILLHEWTNKNAECPMY